MEREAGRAAPAGREENNRLNDCRTFRMSVRACVCVCLVGGAMKGERRQ